ncbi:MAG: ATP-binding protein [Bacteroidota bacterium]
MCRTCILLLLFVILAPASAQEFSHYDITDGLSSVEVTAITENDNFMWIATCDGLNRFDGKNFKVFKREMDSDNSLSENNIETLYFDSSGLLWIGLKTGGVDVYDPGRETFTHISRLIDEKWPLRVISILEDSGKNIWLGTWEEGVYRLTPRNDGSGKYEVVKRYPGYIVSGLLEKPAGYVRIATYSGLFLYVMNNERWIDQGHYDQAITQFLDRGESDGFWYSTWNSGISSISFDPHCPDSITATHSYSGDEWNSAYRILGGDDNSIYFGTWGEGVKRFSTARSSSPEIIGDESFTASLINCLFRDRYNNIWIGTYGGGIFRFNPTPSGIDHFPHTGQLPAPVISLASTGNDRILIGTQGHGVFLYQPGESELLPRFSNSRSGDFSSYILSLYSDEEIIFVGHDGYGLPYYFREQGNAGDCQFSEFYPDSKLEKVTAWYHDENNLIWIGTKQNGLYSFSIDPAKKTIRVVTHHPSFGRDEITGFAEAGNDRLFISSHNGLYVFSKTEKKVIEEGALITNEIVYRITRDEAHNCLWIGTSVNLLRLSLSDYRQLSQVYPNDLIPKGAIRVLNTDVENNLWFAIGERLFCILSTSGQIREINPGFIGNHAIMSACTSRIAGADKLVLGTTGNLVLIEPAVLLRQPGESRILFTGLQIDHRPIAVGEKVYGTVVLNKATEYISAMKLSYKCRWISLTFTETGWNYFINRYQYRIAGFSDSWQLLNLDLPITFSQLDPGSYTLEIRPYSQSGDSEVCWSLALTILPPWWRTKLFFLLLSLSILLLIAMSVKVLVNYYKRRQQIRLAAIEKEKEEELLREKESFFTGLSHDLLTPFSLILAPVNDLIREEQPDEGTREKLEIIRKNTSFLSDVFGTILDFKKAGLAGTQVRESEVEIISFTRVIVNAFDYLAQSRKISLGFHSPLSALTIRTDTVKYERILYNLLSNAIKYTPDGGSVTVALGRNDENSVLITVEDNGSGMDIKNQSRIFDKFYREPDRPGRQNAQGLGLGLYIVRKFTEMLEGRVEVQSEPGKGTVITVHLPVKTVPERYAGNEIGQEGIRSDYSTILVAEDNDELRNYLRDKLSVRFNVITATNGREALQLLNEHLPEILISDVMMPEIDGLQLTEKIKEDHRFADIFVVLLTARTSTDDELTGYRRGADIYLRKPFDPEVLLSQMINIDATRQRRKSQLLTSLVSREQDEIVFDSRETFLQRSMQAIEEHIMDAGFRIDEFAADMNMSKAVLHRKFKLLVGQTPNQFIRLVRLRKALHLLAHTDQTVAEIAYRTGFNQSHYFIKCFREVYNETPGEYRIRIGGEK